MNKVINYVLVPIYLLIRILMTPIALLFFPRAFWLDVAIRKNARENKRRASEGKEPIDIIY